jgi:HK97 family phage major capsid protein
MWDKIYRLTPSGSTTEPQIMTSRGDQLLDRPRVEWSDMATATTTGTKLLLYGDFRQFRIADRIGMTVELISNLVGANHRPTGQRGLFAWWRTGSSVLIQNAFRYLEAK